MKSVVFFVTKIKSIVVEKFFSFDLKMIVFTFVNKCNFVVFMMFINVFVSKC